MELKLDKKDFTDRFLKIIEKVVDVAAIHVTKSGMYVTCTKPNTSVVMLGVYNTPIDIEDEITLNIGDVKKLLRVLECVKHDEVLKFTIDSNSMVYKSPSIQFKYHFLDDAVIPKTTLKKEKIDGLVLDTFFDVKYDKFQEILKASVFTVDTEKIYFYSREGKVCCELGDREKSNTDNVNLVVSDKVEGDPLAKVMPFKLDVFRVLAGVKFDTARIGISTKYSAMAFLVKPTPDTEFKFIISGLVK